MSSRKSSPWNLLAFSRPLIAAAFILTNLSASVGNLKAIADEVPPAANTAPDTPPAITEPGANLHEGSVVKNEIQAPTEPEVEGLKAPVPGNQDGELLQPTFKAINTINASNADAASSTSENPESSLDRSFEGSSENYSVTKNVLTYPLNDPINGQYSGQSAPPLVLREAMNETLTNNASPAVRFQELPLSLNDAKARLNSLKFMAAGTRPQDALENINQFIKWVSDIIDAHNKMAGVFNKNEATKSAGVLEKQLSTRFLQLRCESQLLKADLLIDEQRNPEALAPLVEIVLALPTNAIGKTAYQKLQKLGFSPTEIENSESAVATIAEKPPEKPAVQPKLETIATDEAKSALVTKKLPANSTVSHARHKSLPKLASAKHPVAKKTH